MRCARVWVTWVASALVGALTQRKRSEPSGRATYTPSRKEYRKNKSPFDHSSMDHVPVTKGAAPFEHSKTLRYSALTIPTLALARTTCTATPGIRPTGSLAAPWVTAIGMR
jgi:hypothetical protein